LGRLEQFCELTVEPGTPNPKPLQFSQEADPMPVNDRRVCPNCGLKLSTEIAVCPNDGTVLINNADLDGKLSNQYEFLAEIGSGGMGVIYKARHIALNQTVAIKMLHTNRLDELSVRRFQQEAKAVTALDHPSIVRVRDFGITESGQPHMVLDYIEGDTLAKSIAKKAGLPVPEALEIFIQACDALEHAHMRGVLHRDLKPSNIMLVPRSSGPPLVKIVDFGIAKIADPGYQTAGMNLTQTGEVFGSPLYMSPEQASGTKLDRRSDIYSFGCVMYETLTGAPPFVGGSSIETIFQQLNAQAPPLREGSLGKDFPDDVEAIVARALEKSPDARYQSMAELKHALLNSKLGKKQDQVSLLQDDQSVVTKKRYEIKALLFALVTLIILALVSGYFVVSSMNQPSPKPIAEVVDDAAKAKQIIASSANSNEANLHGLKVTDKMLEYFADSTKPTSVNLDGSDVQGPGLANLIHLPLVSLSMASSKLTDRGFDEIKHMENLEKLDLSKTAITSLGLTQLLSLRKLYELNLDGTFITDEALKTIASMQSLKSLSANQCHVTAKAIDELKKARPDLKVNAENTEQIPSTSKESTGT
jgi:serine/threonine protein kinase